MIIKGGMMADKISVDELKVFVGTGLTVKDKDNEVHTFDYIKKYSSGGYGVSLSGHRDTQIGVEIVKGLYYQTGCRIDAIQPMVRPLSQITIEHLNHLGLHTAINSFGRNVHDYEKFVLDGKESLPRCLFLAAKHYDIFNWIGRGLAVELEG